MLKTRVIFPEAAGQAFQSQIMSLGGISNKRKRKSEFKRAERILRGLRLIPSNFELDYISWGVDKNGSYHIIATGRDQQPGETTTRSAAA